MDKVQFGFRRAPLELIAHVVVNDLPYTEILTADYIMANPWAAKAYGASTYFRDSEDTYEFKPSRIARYFRKGEGFESEYDPIVQQTRVLNPGPLSTTYPHAGILNTTAFLVRYPTTATNRNRARSRWTYYHFLAVDIEKSASRTTDPVALADTNNPTMHNPACTVCHVIMDPVAGAFQNYGDEGLYKDKWEGLDSLDDLYKREAGDRLTVEAESWGQRETLIWPVPLAAGTQTLRLTYANHFWDEAARVGGRVYLDRLRVVDDSGQLVAGREFESLPVPRAHWGECGRAHASSGGDGRGVAGSGGGYFELWGGYLECAFYIDVVVRSTGVHDIEVVAWSNGPDERYEGNSGFAEISVVANGYEEGDVWYRDMRTPGFDGAAAPDSDNSVQWLARRIVADERFAEATVRFWWPAIMGSEIAEFPEEASDADFEGRLLAASAQDAEVARLADGFRDGFHGGAAYNLKDLLAEIVLSEWFRAEALMDADPVRRTALRDAGARRLLTPEELARQNGGHHRRAVGAVVPRQPPFPCRALAQRINRRIPPAFRRHRFGRHHEAGTRHHHGDGRGGQAARRSGRLRGGRARIVPVVRPRATPVRRHQAHGARRGRYQGADCRLARQAVRRPGCPRIRRRGGRLPIVCRCRPAAAGSGR